MEWDKINENVQIAIDKTIFYLPRIVIAGLIFWVGFKVVRKLVELVRQALKRTGFSETLRPFLATVEIYCSWRMFMAERNGIVAAKKRNPVCQISP